MSQTAKALLLTLIVFAVVALLAATFYVFGVKLLFYYGIAAAFCGVAGLVYLVKP